ncbi:MAG: methyltransferase domain-containing protein [Nitrospirota bacterium]
MKVLNLGCGTKTSHKMVNIDWSIYLSIKKNWLFRLCSPLFLNNERRKKLRNLDDTILVHDIRKGLPFDNDSVDVVYHSHILEHVDRELVEAFLMEIKRVLIPGGLHRMAVPDMEYLCRVYLEHVALVERDFSLIADHDRYISVIIEQMVRKKAYGTSQQPLLLRWLENSILGDARKRGETHQWMYDRFNLLHLLDRSGFKNIEILAFNKSAIPNWESFGLETKEDGSEYKPHSLYVEAEK